MLVHQIQTDIANKQNNTNTKSKKRRQQLIVTDEIINILKETQQNKEEFDILYIIATTI